MSEAFKSMSNTVIQYGPIPIPVKIYSAPQRRSSGSGAHMCHKHDDGWGYKISAPLTCDECHEVVDRKLTERTLDEPTKTNKKLKVLSAEQLAGLKGDPEGDIGKELQFLHCVHADEVPPTVCDTVRYLDPNTEAGTSAADSYAAFRAMLEENRLVAVVQYALRGTPRLAVIQPAENGVLVIQNVIWLREFTVKKVTPGLKFVKLMTQWAQQEMVEGFGSPDYMAAYSITPVMPTTDDEDTDEVPEDVADLVAKLEASVKAKAAPRRTRKRAA
jgi:DNA end-binding protein Ku